jgi:hypothetical protein
VGTEFVYRGEAGPDERDLGHTRRWRVRPINGPARATPSSPCRTATLPSLSGVPADTRDVVPAVGHGPAGVSFGRLAPPGTTSPTALPSR